MYQHYAPVARRSLLLYRNIKMNANIAQNGTHIHSIRKLTPPLPLPLSGGTKGPLYVVLLVFLGMGTPVGGGIGVGLVVGMGVVVGAHASLKIEATVSFTCRAQVSNEHSAENGIARGQAQKPKHQVNTISFILISFDVIVYRYMVIVVKGKRIRDSAYN